MKPFPAWTWRIPEHFNIGVACTDAHATGALAQRPAIIVDDQRRGVHQLTFAALAEQTSRFAHVLHTRGVGVGERLLIRLPNCVEYPIVFLGAMKRGAVPVPTSVQLTTDELLHIAHDSGASVLITDAASWQTMRGTLADLATVRHIMLTDVFGKAEAVVDSHIVTLSEALDAADATVAAHPTRADDPAYLVYTSGTTGYPKGVLHAHRALLGRQPSSTYWFDFQEAGDRVLHSGKFNWTYVLGTGLMDPLYRGHTAILYEGDSDASVWPRLIAMHRATIFIGVPTVYRQIVQKTGCTHRDLPTLRHCMSAGEQLSAELLAQWRQRFELDIYEGLGMTECSYYLCETKARSIRPGSAGFAQPGHDVKLLDPDTLRDVPRGAEGMLCIPRADPALLLRYWNQPEETSQCFRGDWFLTGDYAREDEDGYLWFLGRKDDLINSFGYRVSPHEVERVLKAHPAVADAAAVGEELEAEKVLVVAYVITRPGAAVSADDLLRYGQQHLAAYKAPRIVHLVDEFPRTRNGKVLRRALTSQNARARVEAK